MEKIALPFLRGGGRASQYLSSPWAWMRFALGTPGTCLRRFCPAGQSNQSGWGAGTDPFSSGARALICMDRHARDSSCLNTPLLPPSPLPLCPPLPHDSYHPPPTHHHHIQVFICVCAAAAWTVSWSSSWVAGLRPVQALLRPSCSSRSPSA